MRYTRKTQLQPFLHVHSSRAAAGHRSPKKLLISCWVRADTAEHSVVSSNTRSQSRSCASHRSTSNRSLPERLNRLAHRSHSSLGRHLRLDQEQQSEGLPSCGSNAGSRFLGGEISPLSSPLAGHHEALHPKNQALPARRRAPRRMARIRSISHQSPFFAASASMPSLAAIQLLMKRNPYLRYKRREPCKHRQQTHKAQNTILLGCWHSTTLPSSHAACGSDCFQPEAEPDSAPIVGRWNGVVTGVLPPKAVAIDLDGVVCVKTARARCRIVIRSHGVAPPPRPPARMPVFEGAIGSAAKRASVRFGRREERAWHWRSEFREPRHWWQIDGKWLAKSVCSGT